MMNCPKCNANAGAPLKTWKIKQTPIAIYQCPTCKTRWRSKMNVEEVVDSVAKPLETTTSTPENRPSGIKRLLSLFGL